ncbi:hypothetical protein DV737_g2746, partial [Chaetothyriales sp. CBS 132003]
MFGALNRFIARLDSDQSAQSSSSQNAGDNTLGFQVLKNTNKELPLEPWFDFIVGINGHLIESPDAALFTTEMRNCAGNYCSLDLWSAKGQRTHQLTIAVPAAPHSLGLTLQLAPLNSTFNIWHVLTIPSPLSPAHIAGLLPHSDYILGSPSGTLRGESALGELVEDHLNRTLVLWVYNSEFDVVRELELVPRRGWGGDGALGAVLGYGALHRLPVGIGEEVQAPGEHLFDASTERSISEKPYGGSRIDIARASTPILAPPPMINPKAEPPSAAAAKTKKARHQPTPAPGTGFDEIFAEGEKKSKENDYVSSRKGTPLPPPPPKLGSTPTASEQHPDTGDDLGEPGDAEES